VTPSLAGTVILLSFLCAWAGAPAALAGRSGNPSHPASEPAFERWKQERPAGRPPAPRGAEAAAEIERRFGERVQAYVALRQRLEAELPPLAREAAPARLHEHARALRARIQDARPTARPGDIFLPPARVLFRARLRRLFEGQDGEALRAVIMSDNPGRVALAVNGAFPSTLALTTMPPAVLAVLPALPDEHLEYRFVGHRLALVDTRAALVVDFMERALP
jgi:hypothetical protein